MWHPAVRQSTMETWTLNIKVITPLCSTMNSFKRSKQHFCVSHAVKTPASLKWPFEELQLLALPQWVIFFFAPELQLTANTLYLQMLLVWRFGCYVCLFCSLFELTLSGRESAGKWWRQIFTHRFEQALNENVTHATSAVLMIQL